MSYLPVERLDIFYGWTIGALGFLAHVVCASRMSSTLSGFLMLPASQNMHHE